MTQQNNEMATLLNSDRFQINGSTTPNMPSRPTAPPPSAAEIAGGENLISVATAADDTGLLIGWQGAGTATVAELAFLSCFHGVGRPPTAKEPTTMLTRAINATLPANYSMRIARGAGELRGWCIQDQTNPRDPKTVITFGLQAGVPTYTLADETQKPMADAIVTAYNRTVGASVLAAADITLWLRDVLRSVNAVPVGTLWYVPASNRERVRVFVGALAAQWGENWVKVPVLTSADLREGLVKGFVAEVSAELAKLRKDENGKFIIGTRGATAMIARLDELKTRADHYAALLGPSYLATVVAEIKQAVNDVNAICDYTAQRGAMLELV